MLLLLGNQLAVQLAVQQNKLINRSNLLPQINEDIINVDSSSLQRLQHYFSKDAWVAVLEKGKFSKQCSALEALCTCILCAMAVYFVLSVNRLKQEWKCYECSVITTKMDMIACDSCDRWYHW